MKEVLDLTRKEAVPLLDRLSNPRDLAEHIHRDVHPDSRATDPRLAESEAYSGIVAGEPGRALAAFERLARIASDYKGPSRWVHEVAQRGESVGNREDGAPADGLKQLAICRGSQRAPL